MGIVESFAAAVSFRMAAPMRAAFAAAALLAALAACGSDKLPPATPGGPGGGGIGGGGDNDAAADAAPGDAGGDAGIPLGCEVVDPEDDVDNFATVTGGTAAAQNFDVTRVFATWSSDCSNPTLILGLSEDTCELGFSQQLLFLIDRDAIGTAVTTGPNALPTNVLGLFNAQYTASSGSGLSDRWQNCNDTPGFVDFESFDDTDGTTITGTFEILLTNCENAFDPAPVNITGAISVTLDESFEDACPPL